MGKNYDEVNIDYDITKNVDALGEYTAPTWNGGTGAGSKSTMENLARDIYDSSYSKFTEGEDYASLAKRYSAQGRQAMDDTLGQVAARTGGLASSYAASAGQQAYGGWMEKLEDAARSLYDSQFAEKMNKLGVAQGLYDRNYSEFIDERNFGYGVHRDNVSDAQWKDSMGYTQHQDKITNAQWADDQAYKADTFEYQKKQDAMETAENNLYADIYYGGSDDGWDAYNKAGGTLDEGSYNRIVKQAQEDKATKDSEKTEAEELEAQEEQKRAQNEVMMMWAAGVAPTPEQLEDAGWYDKEAKASEDGSIPDGLNGLGQAYYKNATTSASDTEPFRGVSAEDMTMHIEQMSGASEDQAEAIMETIAFATGNYDYAFSMLMQYHPEVANRIIEEELEREG